MGIDNRNRADIFIDILSNLDFMVSVERLTAHADRLTHENKVASDAKAMMKVAA